MDAFTTRPYDQVAVSEIAEAAGTAHGLPFHYFGNKRGLYIAALQKAAEQLSAAHHVTGIGTPREQIKAMLTAHFEYMRDHAALAVALLRGGIGADPQAWAIFESTRFETIEWMCEILDIDASNATLRALLRASVGSIDEATVQWLQSDYALDLASLIDAMLDFIRSAINSAALIDSSLDLSPAIRQLKRPGN